MSKGRGVVGSELLSTNRFERPVHDVRSDVEHGSFLFLLFEEVIEGVMRAIWT